MADIRESPSRELMEILSKRGTKTIFHDPLATIVPPSREHGHFAGETSVALSPEFLQSVNAVVVATDHDSVDYQLVADNARLVIDTRNVFAGKGISANTLVKA